MNASDALSYSTDLWIDFVSSENLAIPAVTDFVSIRGDLVGNPDLWVTIEAYDVSGRLLDSMTRRDNEPCTLRASAPQIHSVRLSQPPIPGAAVLDDFRFNPAVTARPVLTVELLTEPGLEQVRLSWPGVFVGYVLENSATLSNADWSSVEDVTNEDGLFLKTVDATAAQGFYRLRQTAE